MGGRTNLWAGIHSAMETLRDSTKRRKAILLLTDGEPTVDPPKGYSQSLRDYMDEYPKFKFQMNTFGFGY